MGKKPFGIDQKANTNILKALEENPDVLVRCSSEFPFFPACQRIIQWIREERFGTIMEVRAGFNHSSDMDLSKPINWKRMIEYNGEYGCMGDLGIHTQYMPFRMGWISQSVYAVLSNIVPERPDGKGGTAPCQTWDNATLVCQVGDSHGNAFPMYLETKRLDPEATNKWFIEVYGSKASARFTTDDPKIFTFLGGQGKRTGLVQGGCRAQNDGALDYRRDLRVRLFRRYTADVGRLPARAGWQRTAVRLRKAGGDPHLSCPAERGSRSRIEEFYRTIASEFEKRGFTVLTAPICRLKN